MMCSWMRVSLVILAGSLPLMFCHRAEAQCCQSNEKFSLTVSVDGVTASTSGQKTGTAAPVQPGQELNVNYSLQLVSGTYGEAPELICQLDQTDLYNKQEQPGGGSFPFYAPTTPGSYYFTCSVSPGGATPLIWLNVQ